jgi:hypothetical protein
MKSRIRSGVGKMTLSRGKGIDSPMKPWYKIKKTCKILNLDEAEFPTPTGGKEVGKMGRLHSSGFT